MSELYKLGIEEAAKGLAKGDFSSVELTQSVIDTVELGQRTGLPLEGWVELSHFVHQEYQASFFGNAVQIVLGDLPSLRTHVIVNGIDTTFPLLQETFYRNFLYFRKKFF